MKQNYLHYILSSLFALIISIQFSYAQPVYNHSSSGYDKYIFSGLHTLSIHVRDTVTHDSVFQFLINKLKLPVYYFPVKYGFCKYAGAYSGNIVLEPCGPYSQFTYASKDFRAIFFGLTFEPVDSLTQLSKILKQRKIKNEIAGDQFLIIRDSMFCEGNIAMSFMIDGYKTNNVNNKLDSLKRVIVNKTDNELGIEYVKEIIIGYREKGDLQKWKAMISPEKLKEGKTWEVSHDLHIDFVKGPLKEVQSITFKVRSLEKARRYLTYSGLLGDSIGTNLTIDRKQSFGLRIYFSDIP